MNTTVRILASLALGIATAASSANAQTIRPLSATSKFACLSAGGKPQVVKLIPGGIKATSFVNAKDTIKADLKSSVDRRKTLKEYLAELKKEKEISKSQQRFVRKTAAKYGYTLESYPSAYDEQIYAFQQLLGTVNARIDLYRAELDSLSDCQKNKTPLPGSATRTIVISESDPGTAFSQIYFIAVYFANLPTNAETYGMCFKQYKGVFTGKWVGALFRRDPCTGVGRTCPTAISSGTLGLAITERVYGNVPLDNVRDEGLAYVTNSSPGSIEILPVPQSGNCNDLN